MRSLHTAVKSSPRLPQSEKNLRAATKTPYSQKLKKKIIYNFFVLFLYELFSLYALFIYLKFCF